MREKILDTSCGPIHLNADLYRPNEDTLFEADFNEDEVVHIDLVGKRRVYSEGAYNKLMAERDRAMEHTEYVLASINRELLAERDRLRKAIETHRRNKWGEGGGVGHYEDARLYAALQEAEG